MWGRESKFCIDFLFNHFARKAPKHYRDQCDESKWKKSISENLEVFKDKIGLMKCEPYSFKLKEGCSPSYRKPYPLNPSKKLALDNILKVLLANKCIEESTNAEWNAPVILVSKGDGRWRLVIDFRGVNLQVQNEAVVYPRPDDIFEMCQDAVYMFLIDGRDFYFQRELAEDCRDPTTFKCHRGTFRWCRAPQGFKTSSAAAIVPIARELNDLIHVDILMHCDDILGWASCEDKSLAVFDAVCSRLCKFGLTLGWFKVWILLEEAQYVSHVITKGEVRPSPKLCKGISSLPYPSSVKEVQTFIGMIQYFALYIPMLAVHKARLTELTLKDCDFTESWSKEHEHACDKIKGLLMGAVLYIVDWDAEFWLVTDASGTGLGGVLLMKKDGKYLPLRFVSRVLTKLERAYENREREIRAGVYSMQSLHVYLEHRVFNWAVDHMNITFIMKASATNGRIARLALWLSCWWYNLVHLAGDHVLMQIADAISRLAIENSHDPTNMAIPFEDDSVQSRFVENIDLEKAIMTYHTSQHESLAVTRE